MKKVIKENGYINVLAFTIIGLILIFPFSIHASEYVEGINGFNYNGYYIPTYDGDAYEVVNGNIPLFNNSDLNQNIYEHYGPLDNLGRVTTAVANIDQTLMPTGPRGEISSVTPTGWLQNSYSFISGNYLYNRSHLIGWQLTGENANKNNLMTGTRRFNVDGMLPFENKVANYIKLNSENNVLYRVTPVFKDNNLLAYGVIMEAESVDDNGAAIKFNIFAYNVQPNVSIDYSTGANIGTGSSSPSLETNIKNINDCNIILSRTNYSYTGKNIKPTITIKCGNNVMNSRTYSVNYTNNKYVGTAQLTIIGNGKDLNGKQVKTFIISPKAPAILKLKKGKSRFTIKWRRVLTQSSGYQIKYSRYSKMTQSKIVTIKSYKSSSKTIKKLKKKKRYYVQIRTYKIANGKKYYSNWCTEKSIKIK